MGNYNPDRPRILGNEWVPIKQANYVPDDVVERGYTFSIGHSVIPVSGSFNVTQTPPNNVASAVEFMSIYPAGTENMTGPVQTVTIPVSAVGVTGSTASASVGAFWNASDWSYVPITAGTGVDMGLSFDVGPHAAELANKRILNMSLVYSLQGEPADIARMSAKIAQASNTAVFAPFLGSSTAFEGPTNDVFRDSFSEYSIGDLNGLWGIQTPAPLLTALGAIYPWRSQEIALLAFDAPAATRLVVLLTFPTNLTDPPWTSIVIDYMALKITYCEEQRVKYGGKWARANFGTYNLGTNLFPLRGTDFSVTGALAPGDYTVTTIHDGPPAMPVLAALRQLYELPSHHGVLVGRTVTPNDQFTVDSTNVLPQIALHHAAAVVTGSHTYGLQIGASVYGTITPTQDIHEDDLVAAALYPNVRFYARRFGDTTVPLTLTATEQGNMTVSISVSDFDALPEIVDGWKEVTLRFASPPTFPTGVTNPNYQWSATGEAAGSQWQILGASAPNVTGFQTYAPATYDAPAGATDVLQWKTPLSAGLFSDILTDATLILAVDPPTVTGFALTPSTQPVTGIGLACGTPPRCIPTGISYTHLSWNAGTAVCDTYTRVVASGWGTADTGQTWVLNGGSAADYAVNGMQGTIASTNTGVTRNLSVALTQTDEVGYVTIYPGALATGADIEAYLFMRASVGLANWYRVTLQFKTTGLVDFLLQKDVAGVITTLGSMTGFTTYNASTGIRVMLRTVADQIAAKAWNVTLPEPASPMISVTDASVAGPGNITVGVLRTGGNTNTTLVTTFDDVFAAPPGYVGSTYQLQRFDALDGEWQTIMTGSPCITGFNDYEARAGIQSNYRIRVCDVLDFCGPWTTGSATIPAPGITGSGNGAGVLIFTSNSNQAGAYNLAYRMQWEKGAAQEDFTFPESSSVVLQDMYNKDFPTAFRPTERGGEQFSRALLVEGAAISAESLANFKSLRDMAWADLPYVAVRDELGNRWYATVLVPGGNVRRNRTIYMAQVDVIEVTDTAAPVDLP